MQSGNGQVGGDAAGSGGPVDAVDFDQVARLGENRLAGIDGMGSLPFLVTCVPTLVGLNRI